MFNFGHIFWVKMWPGYGLKTVRIPILGHKFYGLNSSIFEPIGLFFYRAQKTIIHWLIGYKKLTPIMFNVYLPILIFLDLFLRKDWSE